MPIRPFPPSDSDLNPISSIGEALHVLHTILHRTALHTLPHASLDRICIYLHLTNADGSSRAVMDSHSSIVTHIDFLCQRYQRYPRNWLDQHLISSPLESSLPEDAQESTKGRMQGECDGCALCAPCKTPLMDNSDAQSADDDRGDRETREDCERQEDAWRSVKAGGGGVLVGYRRGLKGRGDDFVRVKDMLDRLMSKVGFGKGRLLAKKLRGIRSWMTT